MTEYYEVTLSIEDMRRAVEMYVEQDSPYTVPDSLRGGWGRNEGVKFTALKANGLFTCAWKEAEEE